MSNPRICLTPRQRIAQASSYLALNEPERVGCALLVLHADPQLAPIIDIAFANSMARQQACAATSDE
jgi:hypothetical protein